MGSILQLFKQAYGGLSQQIWLLAGVMLINRVGAMVIPFMTLYLTQKLHYSVSKAGFVMIFFGLGSILGSLIGGRLADKMGFRFVQFWSLLLGGMMFLVLGQLTTFPSLCAGTFLLSTLGEAYRPANTVSIAHYSTPATLTRSVSLVRLAINLGWAIGPVLGGLLATYDYVYLFWADGVSNLFAAAFVWYFLRANVVRTKPATATQKRLLATDSPYRDTYYVVFMLFVTMYAMGFFQLFTITPIFYKNLCGLSEKQIGLLMGLNGLLVVLIEMVFIYKVEDKWPKMRFIAVGAFLVVINYVIFVFFRSYTAMLVGVLFATFSEILAMPFMNGIGIDRSKEHNRGAYSAMYNMSWSIAQISAPLVGAQTIAFLGYDVLWYILGGSALAATFGFVWLEKRM